jgi:hypothetical protein
VDPSTQRVNRPSLCVSARDSKCTTLNKGIPEQVRFTVGALQFSRGNFLSCRDGYVACLKALRRREEECGIDVRQFNSQGLRCATPYCPRGFSHVPAPYPAPFAITENSGLRRP